MRLRIRAALSAAAALAALLSPVASGTADARPADAWTPCTSASPTNLALGGGYIFQPGHFFCVGAYQLVMQHDGNLVIYGNTGTALWDSRTAGFPGAYATMQTDGNFVVYQGSQWLWNSNTGGRPGAYLCFQTDGNLVVYAPPFFLPPNTARNCDPKVSPAFWASHT